MKKPQKCETLTVAGKLSVSGKGFGFVTPDESGAIVEGDVFVAARSLNGAMHGDSVVAKIVPSSGKDIEGEIIKVTARANERIVGTLVPTNGGGGTCLRPDNTRLGKRVVINKSRRNGARPGDKVVARVIKWGDGNHSPRGEVAEILGRANAPGVDVLAVLRDHGLADEFPADAQAEATAIPQSVPPTDFADRVDRRGLPTVVTIDGDDSKDFDDAVYVTRRGDGGWHLGVYIADVSHYVREGSPLDAEAFSRGTSVYPVDRVVPMLPVELSNGICSLNAGADRLAMACELAVAPDGTRESYRVFPTVINVHKRLTYSRVDAVYEGASDLAELRPMLLALRELRDARLKKRRQRGALDFDIPELRVKLDADGKPVAVSKHTGTLAESVIEECMLLANEAVAELMVAKKRLPFINRVHEAPERERVDELNDLLAAVSLHINQPQDGGRIEPMAMQRVLDAADGRPEAQLVRAMALRSMTPARYSPDPLGHFGLAARYYTHFTSPIRRYPDLVVHRLLHETLATGTMGEARRRHWRERLPEIARQSSERERVAVDVERETTDLKVVEFMAPRVGEVFAATVSGVTSFGVFVELENGVEGLVHVSQLPNDYYNYDAKRLAMVGERTGKEYRLGDALTVRLTRASVEERVIDFAPLEESQGLPVSA